MITVTMLKPEGMITLALCLLQRVVFHVSVGTHSWFIHIHILQTTFILMGQEAKPGNNPIDIELDLECYYHNSLQFD